MSGIHRFLTRRDRRSRSRQSKDEVLIRILSETQQMVSRWETCYLFANSAHFQGSNILTRPSFRDFFTPHAAKDDDQEHQKKVLSLCQPTRHLLSTDSGART